MAKTLIGNIKGKNGRGITSINKTGTNGSVDTYTITYTDYTTSTFTVNNSDSISLQRQIVPSAAVESSATASQAYAAGDYVVVNGVLRKVTAAIAKGDAISDFNSAATTVTGELANSVSLKKVASGISSIAGSGFAWTVYFIQTLRLLMVNTVRTSGYMKTDTAGSQSSKLCTLDSSYRPSAYISMSPIVDIDLGYELVVGIENTGEVTATVNYSRAMASYGFPNTTAFFFV